MVDHTTVGQPTGCGRPTQGRELFIGATVGQPTSTDSATVGQPTSTNEYETKSPVVTVGPPTSNTTDPNGGIFYPMVIR